MTGHLKGIAARPARYAPVVEYDEIAIRETGLVGDHAKDRKGRATTDRLVSIIAAEDWATACAELQPPADPVGDLPWTTRRANLLLEGLRLPRAAGAVLKIGDVVLEVTGQTFPCKRMEEARPGLLKALAKDWRGGVLCRVISPGLVRIGNGAEIMSSPPETERRLP